jgi:curved DNA-binding protein CbpA
MSDLFALLDVPRRPWLDAEELKDRYHAITARLHPDVAGEVAEAGDFAEVNRAYQALSDPVARLRHLLELENQGALARLQAVPEEVADLFMPVAEAREAGEAFFKKRAAAVNPLSKALLSTEQYKVQELVEERIADLNTKQDELLMAVRDADAKWDADRPGALSDLPRLWQALGYLAKWLGMLREMLLKLAGI